MEISEADFAASFRPPPAGSANEVLQRRLAMPDLDELAEVAAEKAAAGAAAVRREQLIAANAAAGDPFGMVSRTQVQVQEMRGEVTDLEQRLSRAREKLNRGAENLLYWSDQAEEVRRAVARDSDTSDLLAVPKAVLAGHQEYERPAGRRSPRWGPGHRGGGALLAA